MLSRDHPEDPEPRTTRALEDADAPTGRMRHRRQRPGVSAAAMLLAGAVTLSCAPEQERTYIEVAPTLEWCDRVTPPGARHSARVYIDVSTESVWCEWDDSPLRVHAETTPQ